MEEYDLIIKLLTECAAVPTVAFVRREKMKVRLVLFVRSTRIALVARTRAASNAPLKNRLLVRGMAKTAQKLPVQVLPIRVKQGQHAVQEAESDMVIVERVTNALPVTTVMAGKMRAASNAHLISRLPVRMDC